MSGMTGLGGAFACLAVTVVVLGCAPLSETGSVFPQKQMSAAQFDRTLHVLDQSDGLIAEISYDRPYPTESDQVPKGPYDIRCLNRRIVSNPSDVSRLAAVLLKLRPIDHEGVDHEVEEWGIDIEFHRSSGQRVFDASFTFPDKTGSFAIVAVGDRIRWVDGAGLKPIVELVASTVEALPEASDISCIENPESAHQRELRYKRKHHLS